MPRSIASKQGTTRRRPKTRTTANVDVSEFIDFTEVENYAAHLNALAVQAVDATWGPFKKYWIKEITDEIAANAPRSTTDRSPMSQRYGPLHSAFRAGQFGVSAGDAFYWRFVEYGTVHRPPHPFIRPVLKRLKPQMRRDAAERAVAALRMDG